jgi:cysteine synthase
MRVLVCGGRNYPDRLAVWRELDRLTEADDDHPLGKVALTIIHGACRSGADLWADEWAVVNWARFEEYPADWKAHGKAAGPIRNQRMLDEGKPDLVLAFPGGRGTQDMITRALRAGVRVEQYEPHRESRA